MNSKLQTAIVALVIVLTGVAIIVTVIGTRQTESAPIIVVSRIEPAFLTDTSLAEKALMIAHCESEFRADAENPNSSATGIFQFIDGTWAANCNGDVTDPKANIACGVKLMALGDYHHWDASKECWG